jgi:hypothetical protein
MNRKVVLILALIVIIAIPISPLFSGIIKYKDANGVTHIETTDKAHDPYVKSKRIKGFGYIPTLEGMRDMASFDDTIEKYCTLYHLDPHLVRAVIKAESNFNRFARSNKNAIGLMQVIPSTGAKYGIYDLWDPEKNIKAGTQHLNYLMDRYDSNLNFVLAAYNAGEQAVDTYGGIPPYKETITYVDRVTRNYEFFANKKFESSSRGSHRTPFGSKVKSQMRGNVLYISNIGN